MKKLFINPHILLKGPTAFFYVKELGDSGLQVAEWSIDMKLNDANIMLGNIYTQIFLASLGHI